MTELFSRPSKSSVNKAGQALADGNQSEADLKRALTVLNRWRALHNYPINTFQNTLRYRLATIDRTALIGQRLKRTPSIISKLKRIEGMNLARMQDIGGVRGVVTKLSELFEIQSLYEETGRLEHKLIRVDNYLERPKPDGYRSIHLVFEYKNAPNPVHDGLYIEVQLRSKLQHAWATAVETMGTYLGQSLKSRQGESQWLKFFELTSSAFAHVERTPLIGNWSGLSFDETCVAIRQADLQLKILDKLKGFSVATDYIIGKDRNKGKHFYHLVVLDSYSRKVNITPFAENEFDRAIEAYAELERREFGGESIGVFLVSAGPVEQLRRAYPNLFLDTAVFIRQVRKLIEIGEAVRKSGNKGKLIFRRGQGHFDF